MLCAVSACAEVLEVRKIWDSAPHNAFTDLTRFNDQWFCVFREGKAHVSPDGAIRVLRSVDGKTWSSAALLTSTNADLRDPKIVVTPIMLSVASVFHGVQAVLELLRARPDLRS